MNPKDYQNVKKIFQLAFEMPPDQRKAFLDKECSNNEALRLNVEKLLKNSDKSGFLEKPVIHKESKVIVDNCLNDGQKIKHYEIERIIGAGGMGEIYLAQDTKLNRKVVLKILPPKFARNADRMKRFEREAKAASALNHPNIITIYEIGETNETHFIVTEFIQGETLYCRQIQQPFNLESVLDVAIQIASALSVAHDEGIIHRDIKPENIMVRPDGVVKLLDFGIAKLLEKKADRVGNSVPMGNTQSTNPGLVIGTAYYMSPEQAKGQRIDGRSDIFSLGIVIYELLIGCAGYTSEIQIDIIDKIRDKGLLPLKEVVPQVSDEIEQVINKMIREKPGNRYQTAHDLIIDLKGAKKALEDKNKPVQTFFGSESLTEDSLQIFKKHRHKIAIGLLALLVFTGFVFLFYYFRSITDTPTTITITNTPITIAVLPFQHTVLDSDKDYLPDGLTQSVMYRLSQLQDLKVCPPSSVFRYKDKEIEATQAGKELGVKIIMQGKIIQSGDKLIINIELTDVQNKSLIWGEQYNVHMSELLTTQREIAETIVQKLQLKLSGKEKKGLSKPYTDNNEAYQLFLKGRYLYSKRTKDDMLKGINYFEQAIELDNKFAMAYATLADAYATLPGYPYLSPKEAFPKARAAAQQALILDPTLAEAHTAVASCAAVYDRNWPEAELEFKQAIELNPSPFVTHFRYGLLYLMPQGQSSDAIYELKQALVADPFSLVSGSNLAAVYIFSKEDKLALQQAKETNELEPNFVSGVYYLGLAYIVNGQYEEAIQLSEKSLQKDPTNQLLLRVAGIAYAKNKQRGKAEKIINKFKDIAKTQYVMSYLVASIYATLGDKNKAFIELEKSFEEHDWDLHRLKVDPFLKPLRDDERFDEMLKRLNFSK